MGNGFPYTIITDTTETNNMGLGLFIIAAGLYIGFITRKRARHEEFSSIQGLLVAAVFTVSGIAIAVQAAFL